MRPTSWHEPGATAAAFLLAAALLAPVAVAASPPGLPLVDAAAAPESGALLERSPLRDEAERRARIEAHRPPPVEDATAPALPEALQRAARERSAALLEGAGDFAAARDAYARAIGQGLEDGVLWLGLGRTRARAGDLEGAEAALLAARDFDDARATAAEDLAELYLDLARPWDAELAAEKAVALAPDSPRARDLLLAASTAWWPGEVPRRPARPILWPEPPARSFAADLRAGALRLYASLPPEVLRGIDALRTPAARRWLAIAAAGLVLLLVLSRWLRQRGDLAVSIHYPAELRGTFRLRLLTKRRGVARRGPPPRDEIRKGGISSRTEHHLVSRETRFRGVPARAYFLIVEGLLEDPESGEVMVDVFERKIVRVRPRRTVRVECDLHPSHCFVDVSVLWDGRRPRDAAVTSSTLPRKVFDAGQGVVRLPLPKGRHVLVVGSGDRVVEREIEVQSFRPARIAIDIAEERSPVFRGCPPAVEPYLLGDMESVARALDRDGQAEQAHLLLARKRRSEGRPERSAEHYEAAGRPRDAAEIRAELGDHARAGLLFRQAGDPLRAAEMFEAAGDWVHAGESFEAAREFDAALRCYREAGDTERCVGALERSGDALGAAKLALDNGWRARAIRLLRVVTPSDANFGEACSLLADAFEREGHWDLAAQKLEEYISVCGPGAATNDLQFRLADLLEQAGQAERALALLEEIRRRDPTYPNIATRIELLRKKRSAVQAVADSKPSAGPDQAPTTFLSDYRYEILEEMGRGGMGVVFKARDRRLSRVVALKRLPESLRNYPKAVQLFLREAQATARLNHRNIVTVYDADQEDSTFFITMELLEGQPLHRVLRERGPLEPGELARLGVQMAEGLQYAHDQGVIHRDIKTANFFLTDAGVVKIMDFGLAKTLEEVRRAETGIGGTPFYMAPEQVTGADVDHRADLYGLGATFFELATGQVPFPDGDVTYHHRHTPPPDPRRRRPDLPDALAELILKLLAKDPAERCASAGEVRDLLSS
jgi:tetratricopeptide (TPR) repeat protein